MSRYPLALYGPKGWDDLDDKIRALDAAQESAARARGYSTLDEPRETLVANHVVAIKELAAIEVVWDAPPPKRRGRPRKVRS